MKLYWIYFLHLKSTWCINFNFAQASMSMTNFKNTRKVSFVVLKIELIFVEL